MTDAEIIGWTFIGALAVWTLGGLAIESYVHRRRHRREYRIIPGFGHRVGDDAKRIGRESC